MNSAKRIALIVQTFGAAVALCAVAGQARAQDDPSAVDKQWAIKGGVFFPTQGTLRNQSGSQYCVLGFEYDPNLRFKLANGRITLGAELMYREKLTSDYVTIPITARVKWNIHQFQPGTSLYGGFGAGIFIVNTGLISSEVQPGVRFTAGIDMNARWFTEVNYDIVGGFSDSMGNGIRGDGISVLLGYRY